MNTLTVVEPCFEMVTPPEMIRGLLPVIERAGRTCYKSEHKIHDRSAEIFIRSIMKLGHLSVIEHGNVTVKYICSRACSHQLVRHRLAAYSQESQRYCDYSAGRKAKPGGLRIIVPPSIGKITDGQWESRNFGSDWSDGVHTMRRGDICSKFLDSVANAYRDYLNLRKEGVPAEDARFLLPNACKTEVTTTFNLRQWYHVFEHRALNPKAQWEIKRITQGILVEFAKLLPCVFGDLFNRLEEMDS